MNVLKMEKKKQILNCLIEGCSIRSTERMTGVHRDAITRLLVEAGSKCQIIMDSHVKGFHSKFIEVDEIWTHVGKKERRLTKEEKITGLLGDQYCFVAIDPETKLVPTYQIGKRNMKNTLNLF